MKEENIVLIGMRGSGKSTVGKILSQKLKRELIDTDEIIQQKLGKSISEIVSESGWKVFRDIESKICLSAGKNHGCIIAVGGGAILREKNRKALQKNGTCFFLSVPIHRIAKWISQNPSDHRPSLGTKEVVDELEEVWRERKDVYEKMADVKISGTDKLEKMAEMILKYRQEIL